MTTEDIVRLRPVMWAKYYGQERMLHKESGRVDPVKMIFSREKDSHFLKDFTLLLRPMSSVTEEEKKELEQLRKDHARYAAEFLVQWLEAHGFDIPRWELGGRTLKECGLAVYE